MINHPATCAQFSWLADDLTGGWAQQATMSAPKERRVIAVDGKTLPGSASGGEPGDHLLAPLSTTVTEPSWAR